MQNQRVDRIRQCTWGGLSPPHMGLLRPRPTYKGGGYLLLHVTKNFSTGFGIEAMGTHLEAIGTQDSYVNTQAVVFLSHRSFHDRAKSELLRQRGDVVRSC